LQHGKAGKAATLQVQQISRSRIASLKSGAYALPSRAEAYDMGRGKPVASHGIF
jgi:hypothetical protein